MINRNELRLLVMLSALLVGMSFVFGTHMVSSAEEAKLNSTPEWELLPSLPQVTGDSFAFLLNDTLYQAGGRNTDRVAEIYVLDLKLSDNWQVDGTLNPARSGAGGILTNGRAYIVGGTSGNYLANVDSFDSTGLRAERSLPKGLWSPAVIATQDRMYIVGGEMTNGLSSNEVWSAEINAEGRLDEWRTEASLPWGMITQVAGWEQCVYVIGGKNSSNRYSEIYRALWAQEDSTNISSWQNIKALPRPLALHAVTVDQNILYVLGGETTGGALNDQVYSISINPDTCDLIGGWESSPLPGGGNRRLAVTSRFGELYVLGGQTADGYTSAVWKGTLPVPAAALTLHKSASLAGDFDYGKRITYTLSYANPWAHPEGQHNVVITDTLQHGIELESISNNGEFNKANRQLSWALDDLRQGEVGAVSFVARVQSPPLNWTVKSNMETHFLEDSTMTLEMPNGLSYTIIYTLSGHPAPAGALITATLPEQIHPTWITSDISYTTQGQHIIWRAPEAISGTTETLQVHACVTPSIYTDEVLTFTVLVEDEVQQHAPFIFTSSIDSERHDLLSHTCSGWLTETHELAPLYPSARIANQAWICSDELGCQPSNETVTRYWPLKIFLPLLARNN